MKYLSSDKLNLFLERASETRNVYVPVDDRSGKSSYKKWTSGTVLSKALHTTKSAKDFFFPQTENLVEFKMSGKNIEIIDPRRETEDYAIFGVRACDIRSFSILDKVFLAEPVDTYYKNRREHGLIIGLSCNRPAETCFCGTFGIDAAEPEGDVTFTEADGGYFIQANTERGTTFVDSLADIFEERDAAPAEEAKEKTRAVMKKLPLAGQTTDGFGGDQLDRLFDDPHWAELSEACLGCGTCTFVCPTCQCYDIRDYDTGHGVCRFRCWDSCMYSDFTKMAGGNPRLTQKERFRQRFMHKLVYFPANNDGEFGCVGCGRCLASCPIHMNIVKVMKKLAEDDTEGNHD
ncbi:MAG: 4Fe-4S dicluster domain-containing protein [Eubacteriales bacterium]